MGTVSVSLPADGTNADAADYNSPINTIVSAINGNLDSNNLASNAVSTAKIADDAVTAAKINWAGTGADAGIWWEEIARTTLSVAGDTLSATSIPARKYLRVCFSVINSGALLNSLRFNNDSSANYSQRMDVNNGTVTTATSATSITGFFTGSESGFIILDIINIATSEKLLLLNETTTGAAGAGTAPSHVEVTGKWVNTADQITRIDLLNTGAGDYAIGSQMVVLGHD